MFCNYNNSTTANTQSMFACVSEITEDIQKNTQENQTLEPPLCEQSFDRVFEQFEPTPYPRPLFERNRTQTRYVPPLLKQKMVPPPVSDTARFKEYMYTWFQNLADDNRHLHDILKYEIHDEFDYTTLFDKDTIVCAEKIFQRWDEFDLVPRDMSRVTMTRGSSANRRCVQIPHFVVDEEHEFDSDTSE